MDKAMHSEFEGHKSRLEKDSEIWVFSHAHDVFGISAQEAYIAGATREILNNSEENQSLRSELQKLKDEFNFMRNRFHQINKQLMDDLVKQKELNAII